MALIITIHNRQLFIRKLTLEITQGFIKTWFIDSEGDFTLTHPNWRAKAWFRLHLSEQNEDQIIFGIIPSTLFPMTRELYGVYHGRLAATLIANYDDEIIDLSITPGYHKLDFPPF